MALVNMITKVLPKLLNIVDIMATTTTKHTETSKAA
jgi:hypothetical protein